MCGIVGFTHNHNNINENEILKKMADSIQHRGPDDEGFFHCKEVSLGHRRLSIIDLGGGHQPIFNEDGSLIIVFNGEIYNFQEIKEDLIKKGHHFKTHSDTEVIIHLYEEHKEDCLKYLNGMFAFTIWDQRDKCLFMARDRSGKKPLYYAQIENEMVFASEIKAFTHYPKFKKEIDQLSLYKYLAHEYVPTPNTIFKGVNKLEAGHFIIYKNDKIINRPYWDYSLKNAQSNKMSEQEILNKLDDLLKASVKRRLISDVPLGVFLSGGIDSSSLVAYMADLMPSKDIKTFSIGFEDKSFDESPYAKVIADHFNTSHHEKILDPKTLIDILPEVTQFLDEPFADASIIPTYLLSKFTRENVTVALGGDGGDELFMGYPTFQAGKLAKVYDWMPQIIHKNVVENIANRMPVSMNNLSLDFKIKQFLYGVKADKSYREQLWLGAFSLDAIRDLSIDKDIQSLDNNSLFSEVISYNKNHDARHYLDQLSYFYMKSYLHDDILVKVDRASMATSLETRAPFLDVEVMDFVGTIPHKYKLNKLKTKYILKKLLTKRIPEEIINRPKKGFGIPVAKWFRSDLKDMVLDVFSEGKIKREGFFNYSYIKTLLDDHFAMKKDNRKKLWTLFIFELWLEKWGQ